MAALIPWTDVQTELKIIFPEGTPHLGYVTRDIAAKTVFTALYVGAVENTGHWFAPKHVYHMSDKQAAQTSLDVRKAYALKVMKPGGRVPGRRWYADNSRESIRDETIREGLISLGAAIEKADVPTTSSKPRYALRQTFAALFDSALTGQALQNAISAWQEKALTKGALARISIVRSGGAIGGQFVVVAFPNGDTLRMKPGPSSEITKAVIEVFAPLYLRDAAVLFVSESGRKVLAHQDTLAREIGLKIKADKNLPDLILVDLGPEHPLLVFIEIVATDGPINARRKEVLERMASEAGFSDANTAYVTAYLDRGGMPFKKTVGSLAWGSYAWFASEPEYLIELKNKPTKLG